MYKSILKQYIERLKKEDIIKFIGKNNYQVSDKEIDTIYFYIKNYWEDIFDNQEDIWNKIKQEVISYMIDNEVVDQQAQKDKIKVTDDEVNQKYSQIEKI